MRHARFLAGVVACALLLLGCSSTSDTALTDALKALDVPATSTPPATSTTPATTTGPTPPCDDPKASLRPLGPLPPPGHMPAGSYMRHIQDSGHLTVGVDQNTLLFGYFDPQTQQIVGFEVDLAREVARAIFGHAANMEMKAVLTVDRIPLVADGKVDLMADAVSVTCDRAKQVDFSTVYFDAHQRTLVRSNSPAQRLEDLRGHAVCATLGSTALQVVREPKYHLRAYPVAARTDCLVALQEGTVDGIQADDTILYGLHAQDRNTRILSPSYRDEPYGIAINQGHPEFVRFVNAVLERMRADKTWQRIYAKWLGSLANVPTPVPPSPIYKSDGS